MNRIIRTECNCTGGIRTADCDCPGYDRDDIICNGSTHRRANCGVWGEVEDDGPCDCGEAAPGGAR